MIKIGGRVSNMGLSLFIVENSRYDSPRTNEYPLRRVLAVGVKHCLGSVHPREGINEACVDRRGIDDIPIPTLRKFI